QDEALAIKKIQELNPNLQWFLLTKGSKGVYAIVNNNQYNVAGFKVDPVDTTGAGDSFIGAVLYCLANHKLKDPTDVLKFANAVGAITTTREGAISALPFLEEVELFMREHV